MTERSDDTPLAQVANLGPVSARWLAAVGVTTLGELRARPLIDLWIEVRLREPGASRNLYYALWGALHGRDWRTIPTGEKARLDAALRERGLAPPTVSGRRRRAAASRSRGR